MSYLCDLGCQVHCSEKLSILTWVCILNYAEKFRDFQEIYFLGTELEYTYYTR